MSNSAWYEQIVVKGAGLPEGQYEVTIKGIEHEYKVVQNRAGLAGKSVISKEYEALDATQKALVDGIDDEYWPQRPGDKEARKKAAFVDQVRFVFNEPKSGTDLKFGATFPNAEYSKDGTVINSSNKKLVDFIVRSTGAPLVAGDAVKFSDFFKMGDAFVLTLIKKGNFTEIDPNSVMKKELAGPIVKGTAALSAKATTLLEYLKANMQGKSKREIADLYGMSIGGMSYQETQQAWQEIMKNVPYTKDSKTLDFSEAV